MINEIFLKNASVEKLNKIKDILQNRLLTKDTDNQERKVLIELSIELINDELNLRKNAESEGI